MQGCPTYPQNFLTLNSACGSLRLPWRLAGAVEEWMVGLQARDGGLDGKVEPAWEMRAQQARQLARCPVN